MSKLNRIIRILKEEGIGVLLSKAHRRKTEYLDYIYLQRKMREIHLISKKKRNWQKQYVFKEPVKFSIITPLYNTPKKYLVELLKSLEKQTYSNWELCLADGSDSDHTYVKKLCCKWHRRDSRIIYIKLKENKGISHNTNACIKISNGQYLGLLDHDDILHESALFEMMMQISKYNADFLYTDEAKFSGKLKDAVDFNFKPGFGKDELRSHNYICHFTVFSRELLRKVGQAYRSEFDGSQDHDMVLRLTEKAKKIVHIPKVLYYWRVHPESVSMNLDVKNYAVDAAIRAVSEQLERTKEYGTVGSNLPYQTIYRTRYQISTEKTVSVFVHGMSHMQEYEEFVSKIRDITEYQGLEFFPIMEEGKETFGQLMNQAVEQSDAEYVVIMDVRCIPLEAGWIEELLMFAQRKDVAAVAPKIMFGNGAIAYAGIALDGELECKIRYLCKGIPDTDQGYEAILRYVRNTTSVWRGCFMIERNKLQSLHGFEENMCGYEEIDLSLRAMKAGFWNVWTCFAPMQLTVDSIENNGKRDTLKFSEIWKSEIRRGDAFYHPNWRKLKLV